MRSFAVRSDCQTHIFIYFMLKTTDLSDITKNSGTENFLKINLKYAYDGMDIAN